MTVTLHQGDCLDVMRQLPDASIDAVVTDPPYGISFMGKHWDRFDIDRRVGKRDVSKLGVRLTGGADSANRRETARTASAFANPAGEAGGYDMTPAGARRFQAEAEAWATEWLRLLKPGGYAVVFGSTRMYHRLAAGIEDAGFAIRDTLAWMFGQGFPKSLDLAKAVDKSAGHWRGRAGDALSDNGAMSGPNYARTEKGDPITAAAAAAAAGWGTALKPGYEPIVLARKPLDGTTAANFARHGVGALNIDGCRIPLQAGEGWDGGDEPPTPRDGGIGFASSSSSSELGRWPANVLLDEQAAALLDEQTGELQSGSGSLNRHADKSRTAYGAFAGTDEADVLYGDKGGASRFFYCAKVSTAERNAGCEPSLLNPDAPERNGHPTVKPLALMRWLIRLVTPEGATVLDPFLGSGSTACAALLERRSIIGIEREREYLDVARARVAYWSAQPVDEAAA